MHKSRQLLSAYLSFLVTYSSVGPTVKFSAMQCETVHSQASKTVRYSSCAQAVICHRSDLSGAEEQQFWEESAARWRAASISPAQEEQEQNKFMSHLSWLRGCDQAAAVSSERDQQFRSERGEAAQAAGLGGGDRAVASNSHIDEQFREGQVAQDEFCRGLDGERAAEDLPMDAGIPSGTVGGSSGMAVGEQWGRAELFPQPWGVQSPRQRQRRAAEVIISLSMDLCVFFVHAYLSLSFLSHILCQNLVLFRCMCMSSTVFGPVCGPEQH